MLIWVTPLTRHLWMAELRSKHAEDGQVSLLCAILSTPHLIAIQVFIATLMGVYFYFTSQGLRVKERVEERARV